MCGIIGITSGKPVSSAIINSLRKLEYRGYDSAGLATLSEGIINEVKSEGRVESLEKNIAIKSGMYFLIYHLSNYLVNIMALWIFIDLIGVINFFFLES